MVSILVVDDDPVARVLLRHLISRRGYESVEVDDGAEALAVLRDRRFDLIISDQNMPGLSGLELRDALGEHLDTPFVLLTGHAERTELTSTEGLALVDAFITKPVSSHDFNALLDRLVECDRHQDDGDIVGLEVD